LNNFEALHRLNLDGGTQWISGRQSPALSRRLIGTAIWRGGYNSGKIDSTNNKYLDTECGINRVAIRSTQKPGAIMLTATRAGLESATVKLDSKLVDIQDGLAQP